MRTFTVSWLPGACLLLGVLLLGQRAPAQTAPAWTSARNAGATRTLWSRRVLDAAGNMYEVSSFTGSTTVGGTPLTSQGDLDGYLAKYTPTGALSWVRQLGSPAEDQAKDVAVDAAGNVYVVGSFSQTMSLGGGQTLSMGNYAGIKAFVARFDAQGTPVWARQNDPSPAVIGVPPQAYANGVYVDAADQVVVTGFYSISGSFSFGGTQSLPRADASTLLPTFLARFSASTGAPLSLGPGFFSDPRSGGGAAPIYPLQVLEAPGGGTYLVTNYYMAPGFATGLTFPAATDVNILVAKYSATGSLDWARTFGGPDFDGVQRARTDAAGNLYIAGLFHRSLRFGSTTLTSNGFNDDAFLVRYSPQGVEEWAQSFGGTGNEVFNDLAVDAAGNAYVTGVFNNEVHFGPTTLYPVGRNDVVVAAYTPQGQPRWVQQAGGPEEDQGLNLSLSPQGGLYVTGIISPGARFGSLTPASLGYNMGFVAELASTALAATPARPQIMGLYPNPTHDQLQLPDLPTGTAVQLVDALGRVVRTATPGPGAPVSVRGLVPGLYELCARDAQGRHYAARVTVE